MILANIGFNKERTQAFDSLALDNAVPGRVIWQGGYSYRIICKDGEYEGGITGKLKAGNLPAVGDWVAVRLEDSGEKATVLAVLPRSSAFSRNVAGKAVGEQVVAANIDEVFIITDVDQDFNPRRLERYITLVYNSGASPVVVLNKIDLVEDVNSAVNRATAVSPGVPVYAVSADRDRGMDQLHRHLGHGKTVAFLGSSGVGKSTIINRLIGEDRLKVGNVRQGDGKGRHITTSRELVIIPGSGAVIDTPGMREIKVWGDETGLSDAFPEIESLAGSCRFRDCGHDSEVGCAVKEALDTGQLDEARYESYQKLMREFENHERRKSEYARRQEKLEGKRFAKMVSEVNRFNPKRKNRDQ